MIVIVTSARTHFPGVMASLCIALAATYLSEHYGGPALLLALLLGSTFNYLSDLPVTAPGVEFSARTVLRIGVALLGARITVAEVASLGSTTVLFIVLVAAMAIILGYWVGRAARLPGDLAMLCSGAVAICGASAALAIASVMPKRAGLEQQTVVTIAGVTALSTLAMLLYPLIAGICQLDERQAGIFIGATVHDVAQVVGAGYMISPDAGDTATIVKLLRVACLLPVLVGVGLIFRSGRLTPATLGAVVPWFLMAFALLVWAGGSGWLTVNIRDVLTELSRHCLVVAVAALGMRTSIAQFAVIGPGVATTIVLQSLFLMAAVLGALTLDS